MDDALCAGSMMWRRWGRVQLRALTRADLAVLVEVEASGGAQRWRCLEGWPGAAAVAALVRAYPDLQLVVQLDQRVVGALLAWPEADMPAAVLQPWSRRDEASRSGPPTQAGAATQASYPAQDRIGGAPGRAGEVLRGAGAVWSRRLSGAQIQQALALGRQLWVQQLGWRATYSVVEAAGWRKRKRAQGRLSAQAYLQQVHAGAVEDAQLAVYLEAGYVMRGFWQSDGALAVVMRWDYRAH